MDALELGDLVRVASCCSVLHGLLGEAVVKDSIEHCRAASNRANMAEEHVEVAEAQVSGLRRDMDMVWRMHRLFEHQADRRVHLLEQVNVVSTRLHEVSMAEKDRRISELEAELAEAKRRRVE